jgi:hypothetical protein
MNRYMAAGILEDMRAGLIVLFLTENRTAVRAALDYVAVGAMAGERVRRANGHECIHGEGNGSIRFHSIRSDLRGLIADVVVFDVDRVAHYELIEQVHHDFRRTTSRKTEFIF